MGDLRSTGGFTPRGGDWPVGAPSRLDHNACRTKIREIANNACGNEDQWTPIDRAYVDLVDLMADEIERLKYALAMRGVESP